MTSRILRGLEIMIPRNRGVCSAWETGDREEAAGRRQEGVVDGFCVAAENGIVLGIMLHAKKLDIVPCALQ